MRINTIKPDRSKIDLSDEQIAHAWVKRLGRSKEEIAAAIAKVGDNADAVKKQLGRDQAKEPKATV
jgi:uncharacterized protein DUF3606